MNGGLRIVHYSSGSNFWSPLFRSSLYPQFQIYLPIKLLRVEDGLHFQMACVNFFLPPSWKFNVKQNWNNVYHFCRTKKLNKSFCVLCGNPATLCITWQPCTSLSFWVFFSVWLHFVLFCTTYEKNKITYVIKLLQEFKLLSCNNDAVIFQICFTGSSVLVIVQTSTVELGWLKPRMTKQFLSYQILKSFNEPDNSVVCSLYKKKLF